MTTTPTNSRFPFEAHIAKMAPEHQYVIRNLWNSIADAQNAVPVLKSQIDNNTNSIKTVNETINSTSSTENVTNNSSAYTSTIGGVNNQIGNVTYTTAQQDYGYFILFEDASPVAVSLSGNPSIQLPWYCVIINFGVGLVTVTPLAGTISYPNNLASTLMPVAQGQSAIIAYDGNNYYAVVIPVPPQDTPSIAHEWISAYNAITGVFSKAQPAFTDISGTATPAQLPIATTSALGAVEPDGTTITVTSGGVISAVGGSGTVTAVSVATANGFEGTSSGGATPSLTLNVDSTHVLPVNTGSATEYLNEAGGYSVPSGAGTTTDALTAAASGGSAPGATFNGSAAVTIDYHTVGADVAGAAAAITLSGLGGVPTTRTVNGHALSSNVVVSASDLTTGTLPHAQLPTLLSGDIPNNAANTTGTASNAIDINGAAIPTSSKSLASNASNQIIAATIAGTGAGLTTGPTTSVSGDISMFTGTSGQIADSGVLVSSIATAAQITAFRWSNIMVGG